MITNNMAASHATSYATNHANAMFSSNTRRPLWRESFRVDHKPPDLIICHPALHLSHKQSKATYPSQAPKFWFMFGTYRTILGLRILTVPERLG